MEWTAQNVLFLVGGAVICGLGFWSYRLLGRWATEGKRWLKGEIVKNLLVLGMLSTWTAGIILICYGLGLGGRLQ